MRLARLDCFAALCVGQSAGRAALTPGRALSLVRDALHAGYSKWEEAVMNDEGPLAAEETVEAYLSALVRTEIYGAGGGGGGGQLPWRSTFVAESSTPPSLVRFEADLASELRAREAAFPGDEDANTFEHAPRTARKQERTRRRIEQILEALRAQITALAPSQSLSAPTVVPLAVSLQAESEGPSAVLLCCRSSAAAAAAGICSTSDGLLSPVPSASCRTPTLCLECFSERAASRMRERGSTMITRGTSPTRASRRRGSCLCA